MNPPLRDRYHQQRLWWGVERGVVDVLGSDHAPHTLEEKEQELSRDAVRHAGRADAGAGDARPCQCRTPEPRPLRRSDQRGPQRVFGIAGKGRIAVGYDADLTIVDLKAERVIDNEWIGSKCGWTPFAGRRVKGWPVGTLVRGRIAMWEGELGEAQGGPVRFGEALPRILLKEIVPDAGRRDAEPVIAVFAGLLHGIACAGGTMR